MDPKTFVVSGVNPIPWTVGQPGSGRRKDGGRYSYVAKKPELTTFQEAVKEQLLDDYPELPLDWNLCESLALRLDFFFWRQLEHVELIDRRRKRGHIADRTNLQKALEDALQGILFENDRIVVDGRSRVVEQGPHVEPLIVIQIGPALPFDPQLEKVSRMRTMVS